jgi:hypothetical protein
MKRAFPRANTERRWNAWGFARVIARFDDYTGLYAYHCHILEHEDHEMMRQFRVVPEPSVALGFAAGALMLAWLTRRSERAK